MTLELNLNPDADYTIFKPKDNGRTYLCDHFLRRNCNLGNCKFAHVPYECVVEYAWTFSRKTPLKYRHILYSCDYIIRITKEKGIKMGKDLQICEKDLYNKVFEIGEKCMDRNCGKIHSTEFENEIQVKERKEREIEKKGREIEKREKEIERIKEKEKVEIERLKEIERIIDKRGMKRKSPEIPNVENQRSPNGLKLETQRSPNDVRWKSPDRKSQEIQKPQDVMLEIGNKRFEVQKSGELTRYYQFIIFLNHSFAYVGETNYFDELKSIQSYNQATYLFSTEESRIALVYENLKAYKTSLNNIYTNSSSNLVNLLTLTTQSPIFDLRGINLE